MHDFACQLLGIRQGLQARYIDRKTTGEARCLHLIRSEKRKKCHFSFLNRPPRRAKTNQKSFPGAEDHGLQAGSTGKINPPDLGSSDAGSANRIRSSPSLSTLFRLDLAAKTKKGGGINFHFSCSPQRARKIKESFSEEEGGLSPQSSLRKK